MELAGGLAHGNQGSNLGCWKLFRPDLARLDRRALLALATDVGGAFDKALRSAIRAHPLTRMRERRRRGECRQCRRAGAEQERRERRGEARHFSCHFLSTDTHVAPPTKGQLTRGHTGTHIRFSMYRYTYAPVLVQGTHIYPPIPYAYQRCLNARRVRAERGALKNDTH